MRNILILLSLLIFQQAYAINWVQLSSRSETFFIDSDSIQTKDNYYFYNIMTENKVTKQPIIVTIQSSKFKPFSVRIKTYEQSEYEALAGNYSNIADNKTSNLETVQYNSIIYNAYMYVKKTQEANIKNKIIIN